MMDWNSPTFWIVAAIVLGILEVLTGTLILLFFAASALLVSLTFFFGLNQFPIQVALFAGFALTGLFFLRKRIFSSLHASSNKFVIDKNKILESSENIEPGKMSAILYQGTLWTAENISEKPISKGDKIEITATRGNQLLVRPFESN